MQNYLVFRLYGAMASWGEVAVGELRPSSSYPSRSALLGLLGAALGIRRDDRSGQNALAAGYHFGVKQVSGGSLLRDYHTVQQVHKPQPSAKVSYRTRREEIQRADLTTLLSSREYRCDSLSVVAVTQQPNAPYDLQQLAHAIEYPHFVLCLGRKSCPLAMPLMPELLAADSLKAALDHWSQESVLIEDRRQRYRIPLDRSAPRYYWDAALNSAAGMPASYRLSRLDQPISRDRWQFAPRDEYVFLAGGEA